MKKLSIFFLCAAGCAAAPEPPPGLDLSTATLIDLSYTYDDETLYWPTSPTDFILEELDYGPSEDGYFYAAYSFGCGSFGTARIVYFLSDLTVQRSLVVRLVRG